MREEHAQTEGQFKTLYRSKYLPLKEEVQECRQDIARLKAGRAADAEACEKWRAQVGLPLVSCMCGAFKLVDKTCADELASKLDQLLGRRDFGVSNFGDRKDIFVVC